MVFGDNRVDEEENYKHLGFINNIYLNFKPSINDATNKLKGTFFSLVKCGIFYQDTLHPISCKKKKKQNNAVVLPKASYACENWASLSPAELITLERGHRFCIKHMQSLGVYTRTDIALGLLGMFPIEAEIDLRKLILFGQLCRLNTRFWGKTLFLIRLSSFQICPSNQMGFIPDIVRLLNKYHLRIFSPYTLKIVCFLENLHGNA